MPVIRGTTRVTILEPNRRQELFAALREELGGPDGGSRRDDRHVPVIFEIPLEQSDKKDVLVVWEAWNNVRSEDRTSVILDAYAEDAATIAQALGVTYNEAIEQQLLPYAVQPMARRGEVDTMTLRDAMLRQGGIALDGNKVALRFPGMRFAEEAHARLVEELPKGYWSIVQTTP